MRKQFGLKLVNSLYFTTAVLLLFNTGSLSAKEELLSEQEKTVKEEKTKKENGSLKYSVEFLLQGGQVENYSLYKVSSPVAGGGIDLELTYEKNRKMIPSFAYSLYGEKFFEPVEKSDHTLDSVEQNASAGLEFRGESISFMVGLNGRFVNRSRWPDQYQPSPYLYDAAYNPDDIRLGSTDRYSYKMYTPEAALVYRIKKSLPLKLRAGNTLKRGVEDPNFDPALPGHLTPDNYTKKFLELSIKSFKQKRLFNFKLSNRYSVLKSKDELSRDRVTGKTHYITAPNPLYEERNNKTQLDLILAVRDLNLKIRPFYAYRTNTDSFQGYYSYTEHDFGIKIQQRLFKKFKWSVKGERRLRRYTDDGYGYYSATGGHLPLTGGSVLYKNYWIVNLKAGYGIGKSLEIFGKYMYKNKETNYPSYQPGINPTTNISQPGTKNYDIDFSYTNRRFDLGVQYTL